MPERRAIVVRYHFGKTEGSAAAVELLLRARLGSRCFSSRQLSIKMRLESQAHRNCNNDAIFVRMRVSDPKSILQLLFGDRRLALIDHRRSIHKV
jgi:hypothetical protein